MSFFDTVPLLPEDPLFSLTTAYQADPRACKINLGVGAYKDANGLPMVLRAVRLAEKRIFEQELDKEYLPIEGDAAYISHSLKLVFGKVTEEMQGFQTVGGSGALRIGGDFLAQAGFKKIFFSDPTWPTHFLIFRRSGMEMDSYPYLRFDALCQSIQKMPPKSVILLHACCHNPTGVDLSQEQWKELSRLIQKQDILPFFDNAYQGFGDGLEKDAFPIRYFLEQGHEMVVASSYAKNFGLYGERAGSLAIVSSKKAITSQVKQLLRSTWSNPPLQAARIVATILQTDDLKSEWEQELGEMRARIRKMREGLMQGLQASGKHDFSFLSSQRGIFSFSGLTVEQVAHLRKEHGIYMPSNGRINVAGLTEKNLNTVVEAMIGIL